MYKDPTEFRERFKKWQSGEKVYEAGLPKYEDGYESFLATLPDNQKKPGAYNTRRYWELNGKPKNFAEAIGLGMYTFENDNAWHANSVAYNDKNDTYEFMKPNYHETRWMELVYGYDKDSEFLKDWKVKYNGPMLSDRYVRREKPGLKVKGGLLPKFEGGGEKFKLKKTPEFVQAGRDNSWSKVTNDDMGEVFQSVVARPNRTGGNISAGNWKKLWEPKYEKPLEIVSPEFDILTGVRAMMPSLHGADRKAYQFARKMSVDKSKMQNVQDAFRNSEWNNFLSTKNGDFYYRMAKTAENGTKSANENYFISHTTPWEEFAGMNIGAQNASALTGEVKNGILHLYEFPTKTFGQLKSSSWEGVLGDTNVSTMGKKHLLFGNTSSGPRGPVRVLSDKNAEYLGTSPYRIGVSERPTVNGMYDKSPVYEDIHMGNLTVISGDKLNSALNNTTYNHYYPVQGGIQKELHVAPKKTSTPTLISWKDAQKTNVHKTGFPTYKITEENAIKITPKLWDAAYTSAIHKGDMKEVLRLRDLHFKVKAPGSKAVGEDGMPIKQYHTVADGYPADFHEFNPSIEGTHSAIYTSDSPIMSGTYSSKIVSDAEREYYTNAAILNIKLQLKEGLVSGTYKKEYENALTSAASSRKYVLDKLPWLKLPTLAERQKVLYTNIENPLIIEGGGKHWNNIPIDNLPKDVYKALRSSQMNGYTTRDIELAQKLTGNYDGAIIKDITDYGGSWKSTTSAMKPSTVYQINDPRKLKYADPITYDDAGKIIPLSQRDNFNIADLRYGVVPTLIGTSAYLMYK